MGRTYYTEDVMAFAAVIGAMMGVFIVFGIALAILEIVAHWKIFTKAGQPGWKCLIPVYGTFVDAKIAWSNMAGCYVYALGLFVVSLAQAIIVRIGQDQMPPVVGMVLVVACIALLVVHILVQVKRSRAFGKGAGFVVGLILLPTVFNMILGFGSATYQGQQD
jgi:hypothetical protein